MISEKNRRLVRAIAPVLACVVALAVAGLRFAPAGAQGGAAADSSGRGPASGTTSGAPAALPPSAAGERVDGVAAVVDNEVVLQSEVDEQLYLFLQQNGGRPDSAQVEQLRKDILDKLIDDRVIVGEAKRQNMTAPEAEIEKSVNDALADTKKRLGTDDAFKAELKREGLSEEDLRKRYRDEVTKQLLASALLRKQLGKTEVTPAEAEKYFAENKDKFPRRPSAIRVQVIQVPVEADSLERAAIKQRAADTLARIKKGEPFSRLAQTLSDDPGTAPSGGDLGWFKRGTLDSTFELAAFKLPVGQVSGIVQTSFGYHLIKVEEADPAKGEIHARHILFRIAPSQADAERSRKQIEAVRVQAVKGVDFGTLARRYSKYKGPAGPDGDLGFLPMNVFTADFRTALDTLEIGQVTQPLLNPQGYHLFKVNDRQAERTYQVAEIKDDLPEMVRQAKLKDQYDVYVADLRKKAHIEYR
jgi:peptidyl-prolyl cis-trans isomerase SurA